MSPRLHCPWEADSEGIIKRKRYDNDGNRAGYELLDGTYPREWAVASDLLEALHSAEDFIVGCDGAQLVWEKIRAAIAKVAR